MIEFKDTLLNDNIKQNRDVVKTLEELDKKFFNNEKGKPKGIKQLANAINDINSHSISFDNSITFPIKIYPIIVYTDNSLGADFINYLYINRLKGLINTCNNDINVYDVTFINLNYFEMHEDLLAAKSIDLFDIIDEYHKHISTNMYKHTPFEVFSRFYMNKINAPDMPQSERFQTALAKISPNM